MSLTNPNKVVTEERLAEFYGQLLPYLGGMPEAVVNKFSKSDLYSTTEKIVGCWTDGKPLYQKVIYELLSHNTSTTVYADDVNTNIDSIVCCEHFAYYVFTPTSIKRAGIAPIPLKLGNGDIFANVTQYGSFVKQDATTSKLRWEYENTHGSGSVEFYTILRYTKTTDAANSFKFSTETDYSTTEKIVGTWIDGKPLYQKTVYMTLNSETKTQAHNISSLGTVVSVKAITVPVSGGQQRRPVPSLYSNNGAWSAGILVNNTNIVIESGTEFRAAESAAYVTVQYTKTTD